MASVVLYNKEGKNVGNLDLEATLFQVELNPALVHEAVVAQTANSRQVLAHTKGRGDVRGADKKPWKQKGTGRARHGSRYSPIWRGGGITFGPTNERNFSKKLNKKAKRKALAMVLSNKLTQERFIAVEDLNLTEGRTKDLIAILKSLPLASSKTLVVLEPDNVSVIKAANNIPKVQTISAKSLNVVDLLAYDRVLATKEAVRVMTEVYKRS